MSKTKMLFAIGSMELGGAQRALINLINELDAEKYEIDIQLCTKEGFNLKYVPEHVKVYPPFAKGNEYYERFWPLIKSQLKKGHFWTVIRRLFYALLAQIKGGEPIAVQFYQWQFVRKYIPMHACTYDVAIGYLDGLSHYYTIDKVNAKKKICWVHNDYSKMPTYEKVERYLSKADDVVTVSPQCLEELKRIFPKLDHAKCLYNVNSPLMVKKLSVEPVEGDYFSKGNEPRILCVGRLSEQKAYHLAIEAARILKEKGYAFYWGIIGNGPLYKDLTELIEKCGVDDVFHLLGTKENPYPYISATDIVVQCSIYEGKSIALDEAKILLKPIVCTDYNTARDQIEDGRNGLIVPITAEGVAAGVERLLTDDELRKNITEALRNEPMSSQHDIELHEALFDGNCMS